MLQKLRQHRPIITWTAIAIAIWTIATLATAPAWFGIHAAPAITGQLAIVIQSAALIATTASALRAATIYRSTHRKQ